MAEFPHPPERQEPVVKSPLEELADSWFDDMHEVISFLNIKRLKHLDEYSTDLGRWLDWQLMTHGPNVPGYVLQQAQQHMQGMYAHDQSWVNKDIANSPNMLFVGNYQDLAILRLGMDRAQTVEWINKQLQEFPHWMVAGLPGITLSPHQNTIQRTDGAWMTLGDFAITGQPPRMHRSINIYANLLGKSKAAQQYTNVQIAERVLTHEVAHFAHFNRIPLDWLREHWLPAIGMEQVDVNDYVKSTRQNRSADEAKREDLCASLEFYWHEPAELLNLSGARMNAFNVLLERYDQRLLDDWGDVCRNGPERMRNEVKRLLIDNSKRRRGA